MRAASASVLPCFGQCASFGFGFSLALAASSSARARAVLVQLYAAPLPVAPLISPLRFPVWPWLPPEHGSRFRFRLSLRRFQFDSCLGCRLFSFAALHLGFLLRPCFGSFSLLSGFGFCFGTRLCFCLYLSFSACALAASTAIASGVGARNIEVKSSSLAPLLSGFLSGQTSSAEQQFWYVLRLGLILNKAFLLQLFEHVVKRTTQTGRGTFADFTKGSDTIHHQQGAFDVTVKKRCLLFVSSLPCWF